MQELTKYRIIIITLFCLGLMLIGSIAKKATKEPEMHIAYDTVTVKHNQTSLVQFEK